MSEREDAPLANPRRAGAIPNDQPLEGDAPPAPGELHAEYSDGPVPPGPGSEPQHEGHPPSPAERDVSTRTSPGGRRPGGG